MGNAERKARKRAGIPFTKAPKVATPVEERAETRRLGAKLARQMLRRAGGSVQVAAAAIEKGIAEREAREDGAA